MSVSSIENSPAHSPVLSPSRPRRLSARRGSVTAADPWGEHALVNHNPTRSSSSRLTIVRVPPQTELDDGRRHRRHGSNASIGSASSKGEPATRLSFAFTSFGPSGSNSGRSSPPSPRVRPTTPGSPHRQTVSLPVTQPKLTPEQLVDLARSSCNPRSPGTSAGPAPAPVSFTPLPDSIYLPFIDRPTEVSALLSQLPTSKLVALLAQTFPTSQAAGAAPGSSPPRSSSSSISSNSVASTIAPALDSDPKTWTFPQLAAWLRTVDREVADDVTWVRKARACVLERSELIWERLKGALGVPPELNVDDDELPFHIQYQERLKKYKLDGLDVEGTDALDSAVFEDDSPVIAAPISEVVVAAAAAEKELHSEPSPVDNPDSVTVSPVLASTAPLPSTTNALEEVAEEEEDENEDSSKAKEADDLATKIQGLRFSTSPSVPIIQSGAASPVVQFAGEGNRSARSGSFSSASGRSFVLDDADEGPYDPTRERGPGRPLFPSSFANLGMGPTLRPQRANSLSYTSPTLPASLQRGGSMREPRSHAIPIAGRAMAGASDWKTGTNEYAVSTSSTVE